MRTTKASLFTTHHCGFKASKERVERCQDKASIMVNSLSDGIDGITTSPAVDDGIFPGRLITCIFQLCVEENRGFKYYLGEVHQVLHKGVQVCRNISLTI